MPWCENPTCKKTIRKEDTNWDNYNQRVVCPECYEELFSQDFKYKFYLTSDDGLLCQLKYGNTKLAVYIAPCDLYKLFNF